MNRVSFKLLSSTAKAPLKMTEHASGYDLSADIAEPIYLQSMERCAIPTGIAMEIPIGMEAQIRPRSGLALKHGIGILNSPGTIDADYRGEVKVILLNSSNDVFCISPGMRIAQMVICELPTIELVQSQELTDSVRSEGGFGHTGV